MPGPARSGPALSGRAQLAAALLIPILGVGLPLTIAEGALRLAKFEFHPFPVVQFGWPDPKTIADHYRGDPDLGWVTRNYHEMLGAARERRPAVVFMGDSCTEWGTYPRLTLERLEARRRSLTPGLAVGVGGWSSIQGLQQLERDILPLRPRVVTIYYGWNDHWVALGPPDTELRKTRAMMWLSERLRLVQLADKVRVAWRTPPPDERPNRVDLGTYQATLEQMVRRINASGGAAVLVTAPSSHVRGREPEYLRARHLRRLDELVPMHQEYVEATRRAGRSAGAELCDAAAEFDKRPALIARYFLGDGIHLTAEGDAALADLLAPCIERADASQNPMR